LGPGSCGGTPSTIKTGVPKRGKKGERKGGTGSTFVFKVRPYLAELKWTWDQAGQAAKRKRRGEREEKKGKNHPTFRLDRGQTSPVSWSPRPEKGKKEEDEGEWSVNPLTRP